LVAGAIDGSLTSGAAFGFKMLALILGFGTEAADRDTLVLVLRVPRGTRLELTAGGCGLLEFRLGGRFSRHTNIGSCSTSFELTGKTARSAGNQEPPDGPASRKHSE
jgi:hypothetical protein